MALLLSFQLPRGVLAFPVFLLQHTQLVIDLVSPSLLLSSWYRKAAGLPGPQLSQEKKEMPTRFTVFSIKAGVFAEVVQQVCLGLII